MVYQSKNFSVIFLICVLLSLFVIGVCVNLIIDTTLVKMTFSGSGIPPTTIVLENNGEMSLTELIISETVDEYGNREAQYVTDTICIPPETVDKIKESISRLDQPYKKTNPLSSLGGTDIELKVRTGFVYKTYRFKKGEATDQTEYLVDELLDLVNWQAQI